MSTCRKFIMRAMWGGRFGGWGLKFRIFMLTYKGQFWSYEDVVNMFPVRFELKKPLRIISEHSEHEKQFFGGFLAILLSATQIWHSAVTQLSLSFCSTIYSPKWLSNHFYGSPDTFENMQSIFQSSRNRLGCFLKTFRCLF